MPVTSENCRQVEVEVEVGTEHEHGENKLHQYDGISHGGNSQK